MWGNPSSEKGDLPEGRTALTPVNLWLALKRLRSPIEERAI